MEKNKLPSILSLLLKYYCILFKYLNDFLFSYIIFIFYFYVQHFLVFSLDPSIPLDNW
jgi:hypothetical protein